MNPDNNGILMNGLPEPEADDDDVIFVEEVRRTVEDPASSGRGSMMISAEAPAMANRHQQPDIIVLSRLIEEVEDLREKIEDIGDKIDRLRDGRAVAI